MFNLTPTVRNLLLINIFIYLVQENLRFNPSITVLGSLYPIGSPYFYPWQFLTYMFLHAPSNWMHLIGNMFGLVSFGPMLEQRWGGQRFLIFWLACGIGAGVLYEGVRAYDLNKLTNAYTEVMNNPNGGEFYRFMEQIGDENPSRYALASAAQRNPNDQVIQKTIIAQASGLYNEVHDSPYAGMLGASGAVFGVMFAFAYLFPNTELMLIFPPIPIKAKYFVFFYGIYELYAGVRQAPGDNIAHYAHLGGLLIGFTILKFWERGRQQFY